MKEFKKLIADELKKDATTLNLSHTNIDKERAKLVAKELRTNKELLTLDLSFTYIGPEEAKIIAEALATNTVLKTFKLNGAESIIKALETNSTLERLELLNYLSGAGFAEAIVKILEVNSALKILRVAGCTLNSDEEIKNIIKALETNSNLEELALLAKKIGQVGAEAIAKMLAENKVLKTLKLGYGLEPNAVKVITNVLETKNSSLTALKVLKSNIGMEGSESIGRMLKQNQTLTLIDLSYCEIGSKGALLITEGLKENKTLLTLKLAGNGRNSDVKLGPDEIISIVTGMEMHPALQKLDISNNNAGLKGANAIAKMLKVTKTLKKLNVANNDFGPDAVKVIFDAMASNSTVEKLDFIWSDAGGLESTISISNMLKHNQTLRWLGLSTCGIDPQGAILIAEGLEKNRTLVELYISSNSIDKIGIEAIAKGLNRHPTLRILYLEDNELEPEDTVKIFQEFLYHNTALEKFEFLTLSELEDVTPDFFASITEKLEKNAKMNAAIQAEILNKKNHFPARRLKIGFWQKTKESEQNENLPLSDVKFGYQ